VHGGVRELVGEFFTKEKSSRATHGCTLAGTHTTQNTRTGRHTYHKKRLDIQQAPIHLHIHASTASHPSACFYQGNTGHGYAPIHIRDRAHTPAHAHRSTQSPLEISRTSHVPVHLHTHASIAHSPYPPLTPLHPPYIQCCTRVCDAAVSIAKPLVCVRAIESHPSRSHTHARAPPSGPQIFIYMHV
jgi:hypothetical protein